MSAVPDHVPAQLISQGEIQERISSLLKEFGDIPGGTPRTLKEFSTIFSLALYEDISASVQVERLGFGVLKTTDERRQRLLSLSHLTNDELLERTGPDVEEGVIFKAKGLWDNYLNRRSVIAANCLELEQRISPLLPHGKKLDPHQLEAVDAFLTHRGRLLIADDMGVGKMMSGIGAVLAVERRFPLLIICPASVVYTWAKALEAWLSLLDPKICVVEGPMRSLPKSDRLILVGSYDQLVQRHRLFSSAKANFLIGDESHYLLHWDSQRTQRFIRLRGDIRYRLLLSGTPMPNGRHREIYAQIKVLDEKAFSFLVPKSGDASERAKGDKTPFLRRYCGPTYRKVAGRNTTNYDGRSNEIEFGRLMQKFMIRRTKREVGFKIGHKTRYALDVPLTEKDRFELVGLKDRARAKAQQKIDEELKRLLDAGVNLEDAIDRSKRKASSEAIELCSEYRLMLGQKKIPFTVQRVLDHVEEGHRVLVFAYHHEIAHSLDTALKEKLGKDKVFLGTGAMSNKARGELLERAEDRKEGQVLVLTTAFREGITLVSFRRGILHERWWVPAHEAQAEDRIHRRGQEEDVSWDYPMAKGTLDDRMSEVNVWKEQGQQQVHGAVEIRAFEWLFEKKEEPTCAV